MRTVIPGNGGRRRGALPCPPPGHHADWRCRGSGRGHDDQYCGSEDEDQASLHPYLREFGTDVTTPHPGCVPFCVDGLQKDCRGRRRSGPPRSTESGVPVPWTRRTPLGRCETRASGVPDWSQTMSADRSHRLPRCCAVQTRRRPQQPGLAVSGPPTERECAPPSTNVIGRCAPGTRHRRSITQGDRDASVCLTLGIQVEAGRVQGEVPIRPGEAPGLASSCHSVSRPGAVPVQYHPDKVTALNDKGRDAALVSFPSCRGRGHPPDRDGKDMPVLRPTQPPHPSMIHHRRPGPAV